jgi:hypothetical protein
MCGGSGGIAPRIINLTSRWNEKSASCPGLFNHCERASDTDWIRGCVDPRTFLDLMEKNTAKINYCLYQDMNLNSSAVQPVHRSYAGRAITDHE